MLISLMRNYMLVSWRFLLRRRVHTLVSVTGLTLGLSCCLLVLLYVQHEWEYDHFHENADRMVQVLKATQEATGDYVLHARLGAPVGPAFAEEFLEVETTARVAAEELRILLNREPVEQEVLFADSSFFEIFTFPFVAQTSQKILGRPGEVILTEAAAQRFFRHDRPLGEALYIEVRDTTLELRVAAVAQDIPVASSIRFDVVLPHALLKHTFDARMQEDARERWDFPANNVFLLLKRGAHVDELAQKLPAFEARHYDQSLRPMHLRLRPFHQIHFSADVKGLLAAPTNPWHLYTLLALGLIVLLLACANVAMLSLASSTERAKEIGIRKAFGAGSTHIRWQFLIEALLISLISLTLATFLTAAILPGFSAFMERPLTYTLYQNPTLLLFLLALVFLTTLISGSYVTLVLSRKEVVPALHGSTLSLQRSQLVNLAVFLQFGLTIILAIGALVLTAQMRHLVKSPIGFNKSHLLVFYVADLPTGQRIYEHLQQRVLIDPHITSVSSSWTPPFGHPGWPAELSLGDTMRVRVFMNVVDVNFVSTLDMQIVSGRDFSQTHIGDEKNAVIVNETLLRQLGWQSPYGKELPVKASIARNMEVIGVLKDYHYRSFHHEIQPLILVPSVSMGGGAGVIYVRLTPQANVTVLIETLKSYWLEVAPEAPFDYRFMNQMLEAHYRSERRWSLLLQGATMIALLISCLGLFGMAALVAQQRTKEVGIRKVLGASTYSLIVLLTKKFVYLVGGAFIIGAPVAFIFVRRWLDNFSYHIALSPWLFLLVGFATLAIALLTVGYHTVQTAATNPVQSIRSE